MEIPGEEVNPTTDPQTRGFNRKLIIIFIIIFTEVLGFSIVIPVLPFLALSLGLDAFQIGLILSVFSFSQIFGSPIMGNFSDRYGRKPILIISQVSTLVGFLLLGISDAAWLLILARLVDGLLGSNLTVSQAYISDVTTPENRTKMYGYSSAIFGAGLIFGPLIGGTLSAISFSTPMFLAAGISLITILLVIVFLPESLQTRDEEVSFKLSEIFPYKKAKSFLQTPKIRGVILMFFTYSVGFFLFIMSFPLFAETQIQVTAVQVGIFMSWIGILRVILQVSAISPLIKRFGENNTLRMGISAMIFTMGFLVFTTDFWIVFLPLAFLAFGTGVSRPILTSKLTKSVIKSETGSLLGVNNALTSIGQIIAPIAGGAIIQFLPSQTLPTLSGVIFGFIFLLMYLNRRYLRNQSPENNSQMIPAVDT